jgi:hypothetical protein
VLSQRQIPDDSRRIPWVKPCIERALEVTVSQIIGVLQNRYILSNNYYTCPCRITPIADISGGISAVLRHPTPSPLRDEVQE